MTTSIRFPSSRFRGGTEIAGIVTGGFNSVYEVVCIDDPQLPWSESFIGWNVQFTVTDAIVLQLFGIAEPVKCGNGYKLELKRRLS